MTKKDQEQIVANIKGLDSAQSVQKLEYLFDPHCTDAEIAEVMGWKKTDNVRKRASELYQILLQGTSYEKKEGEKNERHKRLFFFSINNDFMDAVLNHPLYEKKL